ncbi:prepilin-type N-terminal cleavage/methylation domain-containing protein [Massilia sp. CMS3.1]|uniref:prepilin-type N-terminal cleavage/methylation domain-containing protein n=1 Tax=Massilia sp. CMS3.1 TaxID=3373083 RepID=UPI003EE68BCC
MLLRPGVRQAGVSLAEMLTVVAVISVAAVIAIPQASSLSPAAADAAAAEVARAVRFAQREAIRTGKYQLVSVDPATQELRVASAGITTLHPVDKRPYKISFAGNAMPRATIANSLFKYEDTTTTNYASFGPDGSPSYVGSKGIEALEEEGKITIRHGNVERVVRVAPVTGRVSF